MDLNKPSPRKVKTSLFLITIIRLSFIGIGLGILLGTLIRSFQNIESLANSNSSFISNESILHNSSKEVIKNKPIRGSSNAIQSKIIANDQEGKVLPNNEFISGMDSSIALYPLKVMNPSKLQIEKLIETWLEVKAKILSGGEGEILSKVATNKLVSIVNKQKEENIASSEFQVINAKLESLKIIERSSKRIEVAAEILYEDKRLTLSGDEVEKTILSKLKINYILGKTNNKWLLIDFFRIN